MADETSGESSKPRIPKRRHKREHVGGVRVNLTESEARMLLDLQREVDLPYNQLFRMLLREEHRRMFGRSPVAFPELGETGT
jgi:hypothetical protein